MHASEIFSDEYCEVILETRDYTSLVLYKDGEATPVSDLMGRENDIFAVVPKADVEDELDPSAGLRAGWRVRVFEARRELCSCTG